LTDIIDNLPPADRVATANADYVGIEALKEGLRRYILDDIGRPRRSHQGMTELRQRLRDTHRLRVVK